ncbi:hypothetical protein HDU76_003654 [Blyttiomyces sp. JEL0837]|nr:hypothetical protein HDU76_003654 [Blyttiomyces sp. JEL0837]
MKNGIERALPENFGEPAKVEEGGAPAPTLSMVSTYYAMVFGPPQAASSGRSTSIQTVNDLKEHWNRQVRWVASKVSGDGI